MNVLIWFQTNLRIHDNAALTHAARRGAVVPVFIFDPMHWAQADRAARQFAFVTECLDELQREFADLGAAILIRQGEPLGVLQRLCAKHAITEIVTDAACPPDLVQWAAASGIQFSVIATMDADPLPVPPLRFAADLMAAPLPLAKMLRLSEDRCGHRQRGGRSQALDLLDIFLTSRGESYHHAQCQPQASERASSRLSPHLTHGTLSLAEVKAALQTRLDERLTGRWPSALAGFQAQLDLRKTLVNRDVTLKISTDPRLAAWHAGETGLPFLDALMRYLAATGWLNHRLRELVLSLACHHIGLDWQSASTAFARRLIDYDPALFWPYAKQIAGNDSTPRLFHPVKQALMLDPTGAFTRRWLPELAAVPTESLQTPWKWAGAGRLLGSRYPEPLIDVTTAHTVAREAIWTRHGKPLRALASPQVQLLETERQPTTGQLRLEF